MNRLHSELQRLFGLALPVPSPEAAPAAGSESPAEGRRMMVLTLGRPADWPRLASLWRAVQADLGLPAPAIAVNGVDGFALWFALAQPVPAARAAAFVDGLCRRYLGDVPGHRLQCLPAGDGAAWPAPAVPGAPVRPDQWSAFVAPDLAPMFAETPWLDLPPPLDGQAELLSRLQPASAEVFAQACALLAPAAAADGHPPSMATMATTARGGTEDSTEGSPGARAASEQARRFLLGTMHDATLDMALRIAAARALLGQREP